MSQPAPESTTAPTEYVFSVQYAEVTGKATQTLNFTGQKIEDALVKARTEVPSVEPVRVARGVSIAG